jgi:hypothetical protein
MPLSQHDRNKRRALLVRRASAKRIGDAQREIWRRRKAAQEQDLEDGGSDEDALLSELPDSLLG